MLISLEFNNYRCFFEHALPLKQETIIVGRNNAGKSTVIEGLRLISIVLERHQNLNFQDVPNWLEIPLIDRGVQPDLSGLNVSWENLFHQYHNPPASITATFSEGHSVTLYLGPDERVHAVMHDRNGRSARTKGEARRLGLPQLSVLPQITPLAKEETVLSSEYVRSNMSSYLSPLHFRNQLNLFYREYFNQFKQMVERTWSGLQIIELEGRGGLPNERLGLLVRDGDFVAEVAWMGHGLQMWLQTIWFLTRTAGHQTVVLDEPDVYMHPDLQRRLLRLMRGRFPQLIIATHSTEILSEADPHNVLIIDRGRDCSKFTTNLPAVQELVEKIGSAQNLHLTKLWNARRLILVEGKDIKLLKRFQDLVFPASPTPIDGIPNMPIGGWNGWPYAVGSAMLLTNAGGQDIITYCILDSDFHPTSVKESRLAEASARNVELHIWKRKEIENYLINPKTVFRIIHNRIRNHGHAPSIDEIFAKINSIAESLRDSTVDALAQEIYNQDRAHGLANANREARAIIEPLWETFEGRISLVSGKDMITLLSAWSQENYTVSFGTSTLAGELQTEELAEEVVEVIRRIEQGARFNSDDEEPDIEIVAEIAFH